MALSVAPLPQMPRLDLFSGQQSDGTKLSERILAQLAAQIGGQLLGNVITHATGGDQTAVAQQEGLVPDQNRNIFQRFLGDQMSTDELEALRTGNVQRGLTAAQTEGAKYSAINEATRPDRERTMLENDRQQRELDRAAGDERASQALLVQTQAGNRQDRQFEQGQGQQNEQFLRGLVQDELNQRQQGSQFQQAQAGEAPVRQAQADYYSSGADENRAKAESMELLNEQSRQFQLTTKMNEFLAAMPEPLRQAAVPMLRQYFEQDPTPTQGEWDQYRQAQAPAGPNQAAPVQASASPNFLGDMLVGGTMLPGVGGVPYALARQLGLPPMEDWKVMQLLQGVLSSPSGASQAPQMSLMSRPQ